jgi:hypothetical protein
MPTEKEENKKAESKLKTGCNSIGALSRCSLSSQSKLGHWHGASFSISSTALL